MPVNKGLNAHFRVWKTFEVRYQVAKKFGFGGVRVVYLHLLSEATSGAPQMKKQIYPIDSFSVL